MAPYQPSRRNVVKFGGVLLGSAVLPGAVSARRGKGPQPVFDLDFSDPSDVAPVSSSTAGWRTDREAPESFTTEQFDGDDRLAINIAESKPTSGFYAYQGKKYLDVGGSYWNAGNNARLSYDFYVDPDWESDDDPQQSGVWPVLGTEGGSISAYPILAYRDSEASDSGEPGFWAYTYTTDEAGDPVTEWVEIGIPQQLKLDPEEGGWVTIEAQLHQVDDGAALKWRINNKLVLDERGYNTFAPSTQFLEVIINSPNYGVDETYYYDNLTLREPGK